MAKFKTPRTLLNYLCNNKGKVITGDNGREWLFDGAMKFKSGADEPFKITYTGLNHFASADVPEEVDNA